jgi:hypothetical protein
MRRRISSARVCAAKLEGVGQQVLKKVGQLGGVRPSSGKRPAQHAAAAFPNRRLPVGDGRVQGRVGVHRAERLRPAADAGVSQQVMHQGLHPPGGIDGVREELVSLLVEDAAAAALQEFQVHVDLAQRLLEVMGCHIGKLLEVLVGPR